MRINKYLSRAGYCSRREADRLIDEGRVRLNGKFCVSGTDVKDKDVVTVDGETIDSAPIHKEKVVLVYNKPQGLICSLSDKDGETVFDRIDYPKRLFYAGRLDKASRGLLILTNDGDLANDLMRARNAHEREYIVTCETKVSDEVLNNLSRGVYLKELGQKTRPCKVNRVDEKSFSVVLTQGLNRQIRRMCDVYGLRVRDLLRIRVENLKLGHLKEGTYRKLLPEEKEGLIARIK